MYVNTFVYLCYEHFTDVMYKQIRAFYITNCFANVKFMFVFSFMPYAYFFLQKTEKFLPSFETVSFAVKNVFREFNWTEAVILATGKLEIS